MTLNRKEKYSQPPCTHNREGNKNSNPTFQKKKIMGLLGAGCISSLAE
jgi:hypothetical protein